MKYKSKMNQSVRSSLGYYGFKTKINKPNGIATKKSA